MFAWQDVAGWILEEAERMGLLKSGKKDKKEGEVAGSVGLAVGNFGVSCKGYRAERLFGWEPREGGVRETIGQGCEGGGGNERVASRELREEFAFPCLSNAWF